MENIIVLGSGRSGTSMTARLFANAGYHMGPDLWDRIDESNPNGIYESEIINFINEDILDPVAPKRKAFFNLKTYRNRTKYPDRWLSVIAENVKLPELSESNKQKIKSFSRETPFCYKDPRFSYTLPVWEPILPKYKVICIFRQPQNTALSIEKEIKKVKRLSRYLELDYENTLQIWSSMYSHILKNYNKSKDWLFVHYDQIIDGQGISKISEFSQANLNKDLIDRELRRSISQREISSSIKDTYKKLCELASYSE
jgi:hypothetical protein